MQIAHVVGRGVAAIDRTGPTGISPSRVGSEMGDQEIEKAAEDVARIIGEIDPPAIRPDQFWPTLVDDIGMSDFDLEVMGLSPPEPGSD